MRKYEVNDIGGFNLLDSEQRVIEANSPLEAAKKYAKMIGSNKTVKRDISSRGRLVVYSNRASYVYKMV